jgi:hypothetical protein
MGTITNSMVTTTGYMQGSIQCAIEVFISMVDFEFVLRKERSAAKDDSLFCNMGLGLASESGAAFAFHALTGVSICPSRNWRCSLATKGIQAHGGVSHFTP